MTVVVPFSIDTGILKRHKVFIIVLKCAFALPDKAHFTHFYLKVNYCGTEKKATIPL